MIITIEQAHKILTIDTPVVMWHHNSFDNYICYPSVNAIENGSPFLTISSQDDFNSKFFVDFYPEQNQKIEAFGGSMWLKDKKEKEYQITVFLPIVINDLLEQKKDTNYNTIKFD